MILRGALPLRKRCTFSLESAAALTSASEASAGRVILSRTLPFTCTGIVISSTASALSSTTGHACVWMEYGLPRCSVQISSAMCGATGASIRR